MRKRGSAEEAPAKEGSREVEFSYAAEVEDIARELIPEYHGHLVNARIEYVFRSQASKKNGKPVLGKARLVSGLSAYLARAIDGQKFFVLEIAADFWKALTPEQRRALVDHELQHCWVNEDTGKLSLLPHDVEEFIGVVKRHGLWSEDVRRFAKSTRLLLPIDRVEPHLD